MCPQVWVRELAAALMDMGSRPDGSGKASVEELVLAGVGCPGLSVLPPGCCPLTAAVIVRSSMR